MRIGYSIRIGTFRIGQVVEGDIINDVLKQFSAAIRAYCRRSDNNIRWRYFTESTGKDKVHFHGVFIADWSANKELRDMWHASVRQVLGAGWKPRRACMKLDPPQKGLVASARYITGFTMAKLASRRLFRHNLPFNISGGSQGFYGQPRKGLIKRLARYDLAIRIAATDQDVLQKDLNEFLFEADELYESSLAMAGPSCHMDVDIQMRRSR